MTSILLNTKALLSFPPLILSLSSFAIMHGEDSTSMNVLSSIKEEEEEEEHKEGYRGKWPSQIPQSVGEFITIHELSAGSVP